MKIRKKITFICIALLFGFTELCAQNNTVSAGGNASGAGGSASYTIGQIVYTTNSGANGSVAQGVQQPYEISIITQIEEAGEINLICTAYPNPASDHLTLKVENYNLEKINCQLFDINGKLLELKSISDTETKISIGQLPVAVYFLKVTEESKEIKVFKIIKN